MKNSFDPYKKKFSENKFWKKISQQVKKIGKKTVYMALLLYYAYRRKDTPLWAKNIILGILGYFISPIDFIPDLTPLLGYTDDAGMLALGLVVISSYINKEVKANAREKLSSWFGDGDDEDLDEIDEEYS